jgi:hypothetical protein
VLVAGHSQFHPGFQNYEMVTLEPGQDLANSMNVHHRRTMRPLRKRLARDNAITRI